MKTLSLILCGLLLVNTFGQDQGPKDKKLDDKKDKKDDKKPPEKKGEPTILEGTWSVVSIELEGKKSDAKAIKDMQMSFQGNQLTIRKGKRILGQGTFTLDVKQKPAILDYREGADIYSPYDAAIFELKDATLKLCTTADRKKRPTDFDSKQGQVIVLKKDKKK